MYCLLDYFICSYFVKIVLLFGIDVSKKLTTMSDLDRFELFLLVAEFGTITLAAEKLGIAKASLSKQIQRLESDLKINLFLRHKQRLHLTDEGETLLNQCKRLCRELENTRNLCQKFHNEPTGILHVVVFSYFAKHLIYPKLKSFLNQYPKLELIIDSTEKIPDFEKEQIDIAVGFSLPVPNPDEVIQKRMMTTRYILCASPGYFKSHGKPKSLQDLHHHQYISHTRRTGDYTLKLKPEYSLQLKPYLLVNSVYAMIECAKNDLGLIQLPLYVLKEYLDSGELIQILPEYQACDSDVYYHYPKYAHPQPKLQRFIEFFLKNGFA
ncbi:LysR family transcriptional regulator [Facilibium subflavum]|uniref:LysR family transcriptional regulator n=1 Tax=Facilibium subflavum TaxID=2219058 RepID=UPI000E6461DB|nr:LysR family transcriptional regulator [Facilibium subflavum]